MATQTVLDLPEITSLLETDKLYVVRGTGSTRDSQLTAVNGVVPHTLVTTVNTAIDLSAYKGDVRILSSGSITLTFSNALPSGRTVSITNGSYSVLNCAGTISTSINAWQTCEVKSDGTSMYAFRSIGVQPNGDVFLHRSYVGEHTIAGGAKVHSWDNDGVLQITNHSAVARGYSGGVQLIDGMYIGAGGAYKGTGSGSNPSMYALLNGKHSWFVSTGVYSLDATAYPTERMTLTNTGFLSLGNASPKAWSTDYQPIQLGTCGSVFSPRNGDSGVYLCNRYYYDGAWKTLGAVTHYPTLYSQSNGKHSWSSGANNTGTEGVTDAPTERMHLTRLGVLSIGNTAPESWDTSAYKVIHLGDSAGVWGYVSQRQSGMSSGLYYSSGWKHAGTTGRYGNIFIMDNGGFAWDTTSTNGASDTTATTVRNMLLEQNGTLTVGDTVLTKAGVLTVGDSVTIDGNRSSGYCVTIAKDSSTGGAPLRVTDAADSRGLLIRGTGGVGNAIEVSNTANGQLMRLSGSSEVWFPGAYAFTTPTSANVYVDSSGHLYRATSSRRYKENERPLEMDTSKIYDIEVKTFNMKESGDIGHSPISEDIALIEENFATYDLDGKPEAIHTNNILYALVEEIKKLKSRIEVLEGTK